VPGSALVLLGGAHLGDRATGRPLPADRRGCLLAYLGFDGGWVERDRLALLFWPEADEQAAKRNLRQLLLRVRQLEWADGIEATAAALRWAVPTDVAAFRRALAVGDHEGALALYGGPLLAGFTVDGVAGYDAWLEYERERLHAGFHEATIRLAEAAVAQDRFDVARAGLGRLLELDPLAEDVLQAYLRTLLLDGRHAAAVAAYERFARLLDGELDLRPLAATQALAEAARQAVPIVPPAPIRTDPLPAGARRTPRLAARHDEVAALLAATTPIVLVAGEPGIGKTRLLREALPGALRIGAVEGLELVAYQPFASLVRSQPGLAATIGPYREDLARLVPEVAPELTPGLLDPSTGQARLAEALARVVDATGGPLVVDDLQWADAASLQTLTYLAARGGRVYGTYRADEVSPDLRRALDAWASRGALTVITLGSIGEAGVGDMLADMMGRSEGPPLFGHWLWQRSGGNPMFALEMVRTLFEGGVLREGEHGWETDIDDLTQDYGELDVPPAVSGVIRRRLERLAEPTVRVLQATALAQTATDTTLLARLTGLSQHAVAEGLDEAEAVGFLEHGAFRHDLLRQTVQQGIPPARSRLVHGRLAEALEGDGDDGVVADHWFRAGDPSRAREAWCREATSLRTRGLQLAAVEVLERALARSDAPNRTWLQVALADALREVARPQEAGEHVDAVLASTPADPELELRATLAKASLLIVAGRLQETDALLGGVGHLPAWVGDPELRLDHVMLCARVAKQLVRPEEALALLEPEIGALRAGRPSLRLCQFLTGVGTLHDDLGRHEEALSAHREAHAIARRLGARYHQVDIAINLLFCFAELRRYADADALAAETLALERYDNLPIFRNNLAAVYFEAGRVEEALVHYRALQDEHDQPFLRAIALARSAEAHARLGDDAPVAELLDAALDELERTDFPVVLGRVAVAVLKLGDDAHLARLRAMAPELAAERLPAYQRAEFATHWRSRVGVTEA
jgi:DNA-binding SARP family transcriptional activator